MPLNGWIIGSVIQVKHMLNYLFNMLWSIWFVHTSSNESILMPMKNHYENLFLKFLFLYQLYWLLPKPFQIEINVLKYFFYPQILKYLKISALCVDESIGILINRSTFLGGILNVWSMIYAFMLFELMKSSL